MSSGKFRLKQWNATTHLLEKLKFRTLTSSNFGKDGAEAKPLIHCWWEWKRVQPLWKTICWFLAKKKAYLYHMTQGPWFLKHLPKQLVNLCIHINLHKDVYNSFTCNYQNLESVNMFFRWTDKLWSIYMLEYHLLLKNKWCIKPWKHRGNI